MVNTHARDLNTHQSMQYLCKMCEEQHYTSDAALRVLASAFIFEGADTVGKKELKHQTKYEGLYV